MSHQLTSKGKKLLEKLESSLSPFEKFVAKSDLEEFLPMAPDREEIFNLIVKETDRTNKKQVIPLVADTGLGKTFFLWEIKKSLKVSAPATFTDVSANYRNFHYDIYTQMVEEIGASALRDITTKIAIQWGGNKKKYGLFATTNTQKILNQAKDTSRYKWSKHKTELEECMKAIIAHSMDPEKNFIAERWLLGEIMDQDDLYFIGLESNLTDDFIAEELLNLILDYFDDGIILMFDDLDKNWTRFNIFDFSDSFDDDWTCSDSDLECGDEPENDSEEPPKTFFSLISNLILKNNNLKLVMTITTENEQILLDKFADSIKHLINDSIYIKKYTIKDTIIYYQNAMYQYRKKHDLDEFEENPFFPLSENLIHKVHEFSKGNSREVIRSFQKLFDALIFDELTIQELEEDIEKILK
jgi:tRNA A37 threonylcarbamoyladenosine biosynthesis protein TsaE